MQKRKQSFSALYVRNFRFFWIAQVISLSGTWMHQVGQGWLVYQLTHSPLYLGMTGTALTLPILLFALFGGIIADRYSKRKILLITQTLSILPPLMLGLFTATGTVTVWHALSLAFVVGTINAFDMPARQSFLIEIVGKGHLLNAIALNSAAFHGARIIGPLTAGFLIGSMGIPACFYLNALSFVPVVFVLKKMTLEGKEQRGASQGILYELKEGFQFILTRRDVVTLLGTIVIFGLFGLPYSQFLPVFADDILNVGARGLGYLMGAAGTGAFAAAMIMASVGDIRNRERFMAGASFCFPISLIVFSTSGSFSISILALFFSGLTIVSFLATANSHIQLSVVDELRGRIMSVYSLFFLGLAPIGHMLIGFTADLVGTRGALVLSGIVCLIGGGAFIRSFLRRNGLT